jgi:hypothetical protein
MPLETGLLSTKLYRPSTSGYLVPRPRLLERLDRRRERPLVTTLCGELPPEFALAGVLSALYDRGYSLQSVGSAASPGGRRL